jgi:hypothetical protein
MKFVPVVAGLLVAACGSPNSVATTTENLPSPPVASIDARMVADATAKDAPIPPAHAHTSDGTLAAAQRELGQQATTCKGAASLLASQGQADQRKRDKRVRDILALCVKDKWPMGVRECVATADHDPLSCTAYLTTTLQRDHWNAVLNRW